MGGNKGASPFLLPVLNMFRRSVINVVCLSGSSSSGGSTSMRGSSGSGSGSAVDSDQISVEDLVNDILSTQQRQLKLLTTDEVYILSNPFMNMNSSL